MRHAGPKTGGGNPPPFCLDDHSQHTCPNFDRVESPLYPVFFCPEKQLGAHEIGGNEESAYTMLDKIILDL